MSHAAQSTRGETTTRLWRKGKLVLHQFPVQQISDYLHQPDCLVWADFLTPSKHMLDKIAEELGLEPLAVEDAVTAEERSKLDRYQSHLFLSARTVHLRKDSEQLLRCRISVFVLPRGVITVRDTSWYSTDKFTERWDANSELLRYGAIALLHGILDSLVDDYFDTVQLLDGELEAIEDLVFAEKVQPKEVQRRTYDLRKSLAQLRRIVAPMREIVSTLLRRDMPTEHAEIVPYYQDIYDHAISCIEWLDGLRETVATAYEAYTSLQDSRLNQIIKKITSWAAIIGIPTAITGFYGQNLPYPGFEKEWGFWFSSSIIVATVLAIYVGFKKRGWL